MPSDKSQTEHQAGQHGQAQAHTAGQHQPFEQGAAAEEQERQRREAAARTPQQDHTPRQEEQYARDRQMQQQGAPERTPYQPGQRREASAQPVRNEQAEAELREARRDASYGAQVILDYDGDAALGARGGAGGSVEENQLVRDLDLVRLGHDPAAPSNDRLGTRPNFMPGKGPEPKRRAVEMPEDTNREAAHG